MNFKVIFTPSEKNIEQLKKWLIIGRFHGYFANALNEGLENGLLIIITFEEKAIGYLLYYNEPPSSIYIRGMEIDPDFQSRGAGSLLIKSSIAKFLQDGKSEISLKSVYDSEPFWNKMGFNERFTPKDIDYHQDNAIHLKMYLK